MEGKKKKVVVVQRKKKVLMTSKDKDCTFKPKINTSYKSKRQRSKGQKRFEELSRSRLITLEKREKQKYEKLMKEKKECTFRPKTNKSSSFFSSQKTEAADDDVSERLYKLAQQRVRDRQLVAKKREETQVQTHKFKPKINPDSVAILNMENHVPIQDRIGSMQRAKSERLQRLRMEIMYFFFLYFFRHHFYTHNPQQQIQQRRTYVSTVGR